MVSFTRPSFMILIESETLFWSLDMFFVSGSMQGGWTIFFSFYSFPFEGGAA
tara:strand:- start:3309 stop:3464 length:156 start_codon:yes stop_codon:yes gene_type:complete